MYLSYDSKDIGRIVIAAFLQKDISKLKFYTING